MFDEGDEGALGFAAVAGVGGDDRCVGADLECFAYFVGGVGLVSVEAVEGDDEGQAAVSTTIFAEVVERAAPLELAKSTEHPFEQCHIWLSAGGLVPAGLMDGDESGLRQVGDEDSGDAEGDGEEGRDLGH